METGIEFAKFLMDISKVDQYNKIKMQYGLVLIVSCKNTI